MLSVEVVTVLGGMIVGSIMKLASIKQQNQQRLIDGALRRNDSNNAGAEQARKYEIALPGVSFTKRVIAFALTAAVTASVWAPILGSFYDTSISIAYGWMEFKPGFLFIPDKDVMVWHEVISGDPKSAIKIVITPGLSHAFLTIIGAYFGHSISKNG